MSCKVIEKIYYSKVFIFFLVSLLMEANKAYKEIKT